MSVDANDKSRAAARSTTKLATLKELKRRSRRGFLTLGAMAVAGYSGWRWLFSREEADGIVWPLRKVLEANGELSRRLFDRDRQGPRPEAPPVGTPFRVNGDIGLFSPLDPDWRLLVDHNDEFDRPALTLTMDDLMRLPRTETTTRFKCIEGWSQDIAYAGVKFSDFLAAHNLGTRSGSPPRLDATPAEDWIPFVGLETPDEEYYVSLDMESMLHPQTILATHINGAPLPLENGAPLRLIIPVKYGIKSLKRVGRIFFSNERPPDYWAERGYDWFSGL